MQRIPKTPVEIKVIAKIDQSRIVEEKNIVFHWLFGKPFDTELPIIIGKVHKNIREH